MSKSTEDEGAFSRIYKKTEFDQLLIQIGGWSRFQHIQWVLLFLAAVPQAWYTYAPAFAAAKPKVGQIYCVEKPDIRGKAFCAAWQNGTCQEAGYTVPYSSIVTEVGHTQGGVFCRRQTVSLCLGLMVKYSSTCTPAYRVRFWLAYRRLAFGVC